MGAGSAIDKPALRQDLAGGRGLFEDELLEALHARGKHLSRARFWAAGACRCGDTLAG